MSTGLPFQKQPFDEQGKVLVNKEWYLALLNLVKVVNSGGNEGPPGPQGLPGTPGPALDIGGESDSNEPMMIPGPPGSPGQIGPSGPTLYFEAPDADEPMMRGALSPGGWYDEKGSGGTIGFAATVDFTGGTTTSLTLSQPYGSQANLIVAFDAGFQGGDTFSLSGKTLTFTSAIPSGIQKVYVKGFLMPQ